MLCESWCATWACDGSAWCKLGAVPDKCLGCHAAATAAPAPTCESWCATWTCDSEWCAGGEKPKACQSCDSTAAQTRESTAGAQAPARLHESKGARGPVIDVDAPPPAVADGKTGGAGGVVDAWHLPSWPMPIASCSDPQRMSCHVAPGSWIGEAWTQTKATPRGPGPTRAIDQKRGIAITGSTRMFYSSLVPSPEQAAKMQWSDVAYEKLALLDKSLSFTIDMSAVPCGCNAALYLVQMDMPSGDDGSGYCDIQGFDDPSMKACTELDVIEGNQKALQSTLHTTPGKGEDGRCNQDGCAANWGRHEETNPAYGLPNTKGVPSHTIDSSKPLRVTATFTSKRINWYDDAGCAFEVEVAQGDRRVKLLDSTRDGNGVDRTPRPFASADLQRTYEAVTNGLVLVASLWTTDDLSWLDGGCDAEYPKCVLNETTVAITNLSIAPLFTTSSLAPPPQWPLPPPPSPAPATPPQYEFVPMPRPPPPPYTDPAPAPLKASPSPSPAVDNRTSMGISALFVVAAVAIFFCCLGGFGGRRKAAGATPRPRASKTRSKAGFARVASMEETDENDGEEEEDASLHSRTPGCARRSSSAGVEAAEVEAPEVEVEEAEAAEDEPEAPRVEKARADAEHRVKAEAESRARAALAAREAAREAARQAAAVEAESRAKNARAREERARAKEEHERRLAEARALAKANKAAKEGSGVERHEEEQVLTFSASSRR